MARLPRDRAHGEGFASTSCSSCCFVAVWRQNPAKEHNPLPERDVIAHVFEEVFWASLLTEESRPCGPRLIYRPRQAEMSQAIHRLVRPVELTREHLRKLTPVQTELPGNARPAMWTALAATGNGRRQAVRVTCTVTFRKNPFLVQSRLQDVRVSRSFPGIPIHFLLEPATHEL